MVFNVIDSPNIVAFSKQPKYFTLDYYFISILLYIILGFSAFFNFCFELKSIHLSCLHQDEYLIYCLPTIHISWRNTYLTDVQLYAHLYDGMLSRNHLHIKTNWNERLGEYHEHKIKMKESLK